MDEASIIKLLGGPTKLSPQIGCGRSAISNWPKTGIPARHWPKIARVAAQHGDTKFITVDLLEKLSERQKVAANDAGPANEAAA